MLNRQYGGQDISKLLQLVINIICLKSIQFVLIALVVNIGLHSQSQCTLFTYPF